MTAKFVVSFPTADTYTDRDYDRVAKSLKRHLEVSMHKPNLEVTPLVETDEEEAPTATVDNVAIFGKAGEIIRKCMAEEEPFFIEVPRLMDLLGKIVASLFMAVLILLLLAVSYRILIWILGV